MKNDPLTRSVLLLALAQLSLVGCASKARITTGQSQIAQLSKQEIVVVERVRDGTTAIAKQDAVIQQFELRAARITARALLVAELSKAQCFAAIENKSDDPQALRLVPRITRLKLESTAGQWLPAIGKADFDLEVDVMRGTQLLATLNASNAGGANAVGDLVSMAGAPLPGSITLDQQIRLAAEKIANTLSKSACAKSEKSVK